MAYGTVDFILAVFAQLPVADDIGCDFFVTLNAFLSGGIHTEYYPYQYDDDSFCIQYCSPPLLIGAFETYFHD
jgi:hypothetical protein